MPRTKFVGWIVDSDVVGTYVGQDGGEVSHPDRAKRFTDVNEALAVAGTNPDRVRLVTFEEGEWWNGSH